MNTQWRRFCNNDEELLRKTLELLVNAPNVIDKIKELCYNRIIELRDKNLSDEAYNSPGWALRQAESNGRIKQLNDLINMLTFDKGSN